MKTPPEREFGALVDGYEAVLIDAYGVLVDAGGARPGAVEALAYLRQRGIPFWLVTNDASRLVSTWVTRMQRLGLALESERIITSGSLLAGYFEQRGLAGARCLVLGPEDSRAYVREAGGEVVPADEAGQYDAVIVADDDGYDFLPTIDATVTALYRHFDRGDEPALVLPNPDLIYPKGEASFGITSGSVALLLEGALARRYPSRGLTFERLGKPHRPMFDEARRRAGTDRLLMIGDQLETDIAGALGAGIDAALVTSGITRWQDRATDAPRPTYLLRSLAPAR